MHVVRIAMSGTTSRIVRTRSRIVRCRSGRRMRASTASDACCIGMSRYGRMRGSRAITSSSRGVMPERVEIEHANPRDGRLAHERLEQLGQREAVAAVAPVVREILRDEIDLARALRLEQLRLAHDLVERERAVLAAHERNRAERAAVIAPFADLEVAHVRQVAGEEAHAGMRSTGWSSIRPRASSSGSSRSISDEPRKRSTSGSASTSSSLWRWTMQPTATTAWQRPSSFSAPASTIASIDSFFAASMKPHVLMTITSASPRSVGVLGAAIGELREIALAVDGVLVAAERDEADLHDGASGGERGARGGVRGRRSTGSVKIARRHARAALEGAGRHGMRESPLHYKVLHDDTHRCPRPAHRDPPRRCP